MLYADISMFGRVPNCCRIALVESDEEAVV
jgi:hypothetical protein